MVKSATLLVVDDLKISKNFYENILGLEISEELETAIKFKLGDHIILMFEGGHHAVEYDHGINANSTLIFNTQNLDSEIEKLKLQGVEFVHTTPNENKCGRYFAFKDPSGIVHELMEFY